MNALEIRDLSKNYGNFNLSHLNCPAAVLWA